MPRFVASFTIELPAAVKADGAEHFELSFSNLRGNPETAKHVYLRLTPKAKRINQAHFHVSYEAESLSVVHAGPGQNSPVILVNEERFTICPPDECRVALMNVMYLISGATLQAWVFWSLEDLRERTRDWYGIFPIRAEP
ncbi:hypothetical protein [Paraliomyxa miuraensis]|uniref:hypothetical protein n=1 Tax=Paraliomyxa miuraensis TaxID=376150 RepID=UPI002257E5DB|nr:hypothetical protein [Paraliomyxa miuraensis]MCX4244396.1 hypothetical protein [Paraliomyxa miuraensis]